MTVRYKSLVNDTPAAASADAHAFFGRKLSFETDPADVYADIQNGVIDFVIIDTRSPEAYAKSHVPGAVNIRPGQMTPQRMAAYTPTALFVVYCWGPGCNGATKAALRLSEMGYPVKEMIGGIEYWQDKEGYPVEQGATS